MCGSGVIIEADDSDSIFVRHTSPLQPSMFMAQDPQIPSWRDRRNGVEDNGATVLEVDLVVLELQLRRVFRGPAVDREGFERRGGACLLFDLQSFGLACEKVANFSGWNWQNISISLRAHLLATIKTTPISYSAFYEDHLSWCSSPSGAFELKEAYGLASMEGEDDQASPFEGEWIWKTITIPKVKCFIWQCYHNSISVRATLAYRDVAYEILLKEPELAYAVNEGGITPLHLLASKPSVLRSGSHIGWWKSIIYHCMHVEELENETVDKRLIDSAIKELDESSIDDVTHKFPKNYHTCIQIYQVLQTLAQFGIQSGSFFFTLIKAIARPVTQHENQGNSS
nr:hypothetical protein CFP56_47668 [Quercus suber]